MDISSSHLKDFCGRFFQDYSFNCTYLRKNNSYKTRNEIDQSFVYGNIQGQLWKKRKKKPNELLTAVIKRGIYTLRCPLEYIPNCCWHCRVQQQTLYRSGQSRGCCRVCTVLKDHTRCQDRHIRWFLHCCIQDSQLHCLFPLHWWCRSGPLFHHCRVCKEGLCGVVDQRRRIRQCLRRYMQGWWQRSEILQRLSCRSDRVVLDCMLVGEARHDEDRHKLGGDLRVPRVDDQTDSEPPTFDA